MRVGLDIGGTKTDAVAVDDSGTQLARVRLSTGWGAEAVVQTVLDAVRALAADPAVDIAEMRSVGIGIPGQIVPGTARVLHAVNLGIDEFEMAEALAPRLGVPVRIDNDVKAAAFGAYALRRGSGSMAYLNLGTGIAAGIVSDGVLWRGMRGAAGEVGHISVDPRGPECRCGQRGCIEAFSGGGSIAERWGEPSQLPVRDVFDAADRGEPRAVALRAGLAHGVASAVRVLVLTADVDTVVLGGGVTSLGERLMTDVRGDLAASAEASAFLKSLHLADRVELLPAGSSVAALGAALIGAADDTQRELVEADSNG